MNKIAVTGKGVAGKTTIAAALSIFLNKHGKNVWMLDCDPDANLATILGYPYPEKLQPIAELKEIIQERTFTKNNGSAASFFKMNPDISDIPEKFSVEYNGIHHMLMGKMKPAKGGCFECICAIVPEANGFMIVNREYSGMTPLGMTFSTLAGTVVGGNQTPGFMGFGRSYITSKKFIKADGGLKRIVWMPKELKEALSDKLKKEAEAEGVPDLLAQIADETVTTDSEKLLEYLQKVNHPALTMPPLM